MKAIIIKTSGENALIAWENRESPSPQIHEVKVKVKAVGVNQADLLQIKGKYPAPPTYPTDIPGLEFSGIVEELGHNVDTLKIGDCVFGLTGGGAYAEELVINAQCVTKIPEDLSFIDAAAIPEVFITAYDALITQLKMAIGETILISAIGSGVGLAALQIAKVMGLNVIGTSRSQEKLNKAKSMGLDNGILVRDGKFSKKVREIFLSGPDIILELVGGDYISEDIDCVAMQGRIILVGLLAGRVANIDLAKILTKRLLIKGTTLRARPLAEKIVANEILAKNLVPLLQTGKLKAVVDRVFSLHNAEQALQYLSSGDSFGKIVLTCD